MKKIILLSIILSLSAVSVAVAQDYEYRVKAGFNIGGTSPLPLPNEIRAIKGYTPTLALSIGADVQRHITNRWGIMTGFKFEIKGMSTRADVKNYKIGMVISDGEQDGYIDGYFTGNVKTKANNSYLSVPLLAVYQVSNRWAVNAGVFGAVLVRGSFTGDARDGYIRDTTPTGDKVGVTTAAYDFSDEIRRMNWGGQVGASWKAYRQFSVYGDLTIAANSIFKKEFESISFDMYNVYLNLGFAYTF